MRAMGFSSKVGTAGALLALLAAGAGAQSSGRAPVIRVYSRDGGLASNYVSPAIQVSEDAYVFAVAMDVDGQIQILHPDFPGISVRLRSHKSVYLPNFFAGFSRSDSYSSYSSYSMAGGSDYYGDDVRGTVIGIASRKPFNLDRIENDGDWDMSLIRRIIERRSPEGAAQALAAYLGAKGEPIGRDWMRFAGGRRSYSYANYDYYNSCESAYGFAYGAPTLSFARIQAIQRILTLRRLGHQVNIVGYDFCGMPIVTYGPSGAGRLPVFRVPQSPPGTTVFPKTHTPHGIARVPGGDTGPVAAMGAFPMTRRAEPQIGDVTVTAPTTRRGDPRQILEQLREESGGAGIPTRGRMPIEQSQPVRETPRASRPAATGYRPEPQLDPQPVRMPDRGRSTGSGSAPVTQSSPPARAEPTHAPPPQPKTQAPPPARAEPASSSPPPSKTK